MPVNLSKQNSVSSVLPAVYFTNVRRETFILPRQKPEQTLIRGTIALAIQADLPVQNARPAWHTRPSIFSPFDAGAEQRGLTEIKRALDVECQT